MILVFIFLSIIIFLSLILLILMMSNIKIKIKKLNIINFRSDKKYKIYFQIYLFDKIKIISIKIDNKKINKITKSNRFNNIIKSEQLPRLFKSIDLKKILSINRKLNIKFEELDLKLKLGIGNVIINSYIIAIFSTIISTILARNTNNNKSINNNNDNNININNCNNNRNLFYCIIPDYNNKVFKMNLDCIISIKIVHIILVLYNFIKEGRGKNGRTSYRRSYVSNYEFN